MEPQEHLLEWTEHFVKNKDLVLRKLANCETADNKLICDHKDKKRVIWLIVPFLDDFDAIKKELDEHEHCALVCYNTKKNFEFLLDEWEKFVNFKRHFHVYFVNPFSQLEKRWTIYPHTHQFLSGGKNIRQSLTSLFDTVEPITEERIREIIE